MSHDEEEDLYLTELEDEMQATRLVKSIHIFENNHVHHLHDEIDNPEEHYGEEKSITVSEIFFDLVFVSAGTDITHGLRKEHLTFEEYFLYIVVMLYFWKSFSMNQSLFNTGDLIDKFLSMVYAMFVIGATVWTTGGLDGDTVKYFGICCICVSATQLVLDLRAITGIMNPKRTAPHRAEVLGSHIKLLILVDIIEILVFTIFTLWENTLARRIALWFLLFDNLAVDIIFVLVYEKKYHLHMSVSHIGERFEAIVLISLGETIVGITPMLTHENSTHDVVVCILLCYIFLFLYKIFHFDVEECEEEYHAVYYGGFRQVIWIYVSIIECAGVLMWGSSCGELIEALLLSQKEHSGHVEHGAAGGHEEKSWEEMLEMSIFLLSVGLCVSLSGNLISRFAHVVKVEHFAGALALWYAQIVVQAIAIVFIALIPTINKHHVWGNVEEKPWIHLIVIVVILFVLDVFFLLDEIIENRHLRKLHSKKLNEMSEIQV